MATAAVLFYLLNLKVILSTNTPRSKLKYFQLILILGSLTALGPFSIDMYLPVFLELRT
jgi:hypothetical protein